MAIIQVVNVDVPNSGNGDTLRVSQVKANDNFAELNAKKVEAVAGFDLSENNFTDAEKAKLAGIETGAQVNVRGNMQQQDPDAPDYILGKPTSGNIITYGTYTLVGQNLTIFAGWVWQINNVLYTNSTDIVINFPYADTGLQRFDAVVFDTLNSAQRVDGDEVVSSPIVPLLITDSILFSISLITDASAGAPEVPTDFMNANYIPLTGTTVGNPVTGDIELDNLSGSKNIKGNIYGGNIKFSDDGTIAINDTTGSNVSITGINFEGRTIASQGITGNYDYSNNLDNLSYPQKIYVDTKEPLKGADDNYVTDAEKTVIANTSGTNTGDQDLSGKQDTLVSGTNIKTINTQSLLGPGNLSIGVNVWNVKDYGALGDGTTDDTVSIQNTINACNTGGGGIVYFPNGIYYINGALDSNSQSQIYFPLNSYSASSTLKTIKLLGETPPNQFSNPFTPSASAEHPETGVIIKSNLLSVGNVIGSRSESVVWGNFNYLHVKIENISVRVRSMTSTTDVVPVSTAINMRNVSCFTSDYLEVCTTSKMTTCLEPASTCIGVVMPKTNNFVFSNMSNFYIFGMYIGVDAYEHTHLDKYFIDVCVVGVNFNNVNHSIHLGKGCIARCRYNLKTQSSSYFYIEHISVENDYTKAITLPTWNKTLYDIYDVDATSSGIVRIHIVKAGVGVDYSKLLRSRLNSKIKFIKINELSTEFNPNSVAPPTDINLLAFWKFEEATGNYADSSINLRTATRVNSATSGTGVVGNAMLTASASNQYANAGSTGFSYNGTAISFSGWFKINTSANAYQVLFNKGTSVEREYNCYYTKSTGVLAFTVYNGTGSVGQALKSEIVENVWFFLYVEMVGSALKISVNNGTPITSTTSGSVTVNTIRDLTIGAGDSAGQSLNGGVDELRIYNRGLTDGEIEYLYNGGFGNL